MRLFRLLAVGWTLGVLVACFAPGELVEPIVFQWIDKIAHFVLFAGFAGFWLPVLSGKHRLAWVFITGTLLAFLTEAGQYLLPIGRSAEWLDLVADGLGLLAGYFLDRWLAPYPTDS
ncbi:VanZ family protein [Rhodothermus profundi]|nr:VanZ family protein [Rhodothermus profundi]